MIEPKEFFRQLRFACKHYDDSLIISKLPIAGIALQAMRSEASINFATLSDSDRVSTLRYCIDLYLEQLKLHDLHLVSNEVYQCLHWYIHHGTCVMGETNCKPPTLSRPTYYNRVHIGIGILGCHLSAYFSQFTDQIMPIPLNVGIQSILTTKEQEILSLGAKGITSTKEIASYMQLSACTIETHWKFIRLKLLAKNRKEAIIIARQMMII